MPAIEQFTNNAASTLNGAITSGATTLVVTSATAFPTTGVFRIIVESEIMIVTAVSGTTFTVTRGAEGTSAASHADTTAVTHVLTAAAIQAIIDGPLARTKTIREALKTPGSTTMTAVGMVAPGTNTGTLASGDDSDGPWLSLTTSASINTGADIAGGSSYRRDNAADLLVVVKAVDLTNVRLWAGFSNNPFSMGADAPAFQIAAFRYSTAVDTGSTWRSVTFDNSGSPTVTDTGIAIATAAPQRLRVTMSATDVKFYVDGVLAATHTTHLPAATLGLQNDARIDTLSAAAKVFKVSRFAVATTP